MEELTFPAKIQKGNLYLHFFSEWNSFNKYLLSMCPPSSEHKLCPQLQIPWLLEPGAEVLAGHYVLLFTCVKWGEQTRWSLKVLPDIIPQTQVGKSTLSSRDILRKSWCLYLENEDWGGGSFSEGKCHLGPSCPGSCTDRSRSSPES